MEHTLEHLFTVDRSQYRAGTSGSIKVPVFATDRLIKGLRILLQKCSVTNGYAFTKTPIRP